MSKFFMKKKLITIIVVAIIAVMIGLIIGSNVVNTMKTKEKAAEQAKVEEIVKKNEKVKERVKKEENQTKEEIEEEINEKNYTEEYKEYLKLSDEEKAKVEVIPRKMKVDYSELETIIDDQAEDTGKIYVDEDNLEEKKEELDEEEEKKIEVLPDRYALNDEINIKVASQGSFGLCWDFAAMKSVETNIALTKGKEYDFSESHVDYMTSSALTLDNRDENGGGDFDDSFIKYNMEFKGFVTEESLPLGVYEEYEYNTFDKMDKEDFYITKYAIFPKLEKKVEESNEEFEKRREEFITAVKTHIINYGSLYCVVDDPVYGINQYINNKKEVKSKRGQHAVSIIGWDDTYSKDNFKSPTGHVPQNDGAYIVLNSWGSDWGDEGYFYVSYEDITINTDICGVVSVNKKSDLIKLSDYKTSIRNHLRDYYNDYVITIDGEEYLNYIVIKNKIDLSSAGINSIDEIKDLIKNTKIIDLSNNNLESIDELVDYVDNDGLVINLENNKIKDVSSLAKYKLQTLNLSGNVGVTGYEKIQVMGSVYLANCGITEFKTGENYQDIYIIDLSGNKIEDFSGLMDITNEFDLIAEDCGLESLDKLKDVLEAGRVGSIDLAHNNLKDISGIENSAVYAIDLSYNDGIENFEPLRKASNITYAELRGCNIRDAKDILIESELDKYNTTYGIDYDLSENKEITNLKALKNAYSLELEDCNLKDISEVKDLSKLDILIISNNPGVKGDLEGKELKSIEARNCDLDNEFDLFNAGFVRVLEIAGNNITDTSKFEDRVDTIVIESNNETIIEIPSNYGVEMDVTKYVKSKYNYKTTIYVNGKQMYSKHIVIPVNEETEISYTESFTDKKLVKFKVNPDMKSSGIVVTKSPVHAFEKDYNMIDTTGIKVANKYDNFIMKETEDYTIDTDNRYLVPAKYVKRYYYINKKDITYLFVPNKYLCNVIKGDNTAPFAISSQYMEALDEDLIVPDEFKEEFPKLTFTNKELYEYAKEYWDGLYVRADDDLLTIELNTRSMFNNSGRAMVIPRRLLYDVAGLKSVINQDIFISMDEENGMDKIQKEDLKVLDNFEDLRRIHIVSGKGTLPSGADYDNYIVSQDKYDVEVFSIDIWN